MEEWNRFLIEGDYVLLNNKPDFKKQTGEAIQDMMKDFDSFIRYHTDRKYEIIHLAHACELYLKGLFIKNGYSLETAKGFKKSFSQLINASKCVIPDSEECGIIKKDIEELNVYRNRFIHSVESGEIPAGVTLQRYLRTLFRLRRLLKS